MPKTAKYPDPRIRLFLSADLVGSTSFKAGEGGYASRFSKAYPNWVMIQRLFYQNFPANFQANYEKECHPSLQTDKYEAHPPKFWKILGDEILFCTTLKDIRHLSMVIKAFCATINDYGAFLEEEGTPLDIKGTGWVGMFPVPNITISLPSSSPLKLREEIKSPPREDVTLPAAPSPAGQSPLSSRLNDSWDYLEELEKKADLRPDQYDFLGKDIDTGFRVAKFASPNKLALTVELAWLLSVARQLKLLDISFSHSGAESLKGVLNGTPYPKLSVDMERSFIKHRLRKIENALHGRKPILPFTLSEYLTIFMMAEKVKSPLIDPEAFFFPFSCGDILSWEKVPTWEEEYNEIKNSWHSSQ